MIGGIIMTQEEYESLKELLLKDLCARLPYGVIGQCKIDASYDTSFETKPQTHKFDAEVYGLLEEGLLLVTPLIEDQDVQELANEEVADGVNILDFKPYLFPLSSLTEEQRNNISKLLIDTQNEFSPYGKLNMKGCDNLFICSVKQSNALINYCLANHLDINGLIEKGLAIDATGLNIYC